MRKIKSLKIVDQFQNSKIDDMNAKKQYVEKYINNSIEKSSVFFKSLYFEKLSFGIHAS